MNFGIKSGFEFKGESRVNVFDISAQRQVLKNSKPQFKMGIGISRNFAA
jgi:hypothetical protein